MKHFMIKYRFKSGSPEEWRGHIAQFISNLNSDPDLKGKISYRCMKERDGAEYYHLARPPTTSRRQLCRARNFSSSIQRKPGA